MIEPELPILPIEATAGPGPEQTALGAAGDGGSSASSRRLHRRALTTDALLVVKTIIAYVIGNALAMGVALGWVFTGSFPSQGSYYLRVGDQTYPFNSKFLISRCVVAGAFVTFAILFARRAPDGVSGRLLLVRPRIPARLVWFFLPVTCTLWLAGVPLMWIATKLGLSEGLELFTPRSLSAPWSWRLAFVGVATLGPGIGEEFLFRGYLQQGLHGTRRAWTAILVASVAFSLSHRDLAQMLLVLPSAMWLGFVTYRSGSLLTAIVCHSFLNLVGNVAIATGVNAMALYICIGIVGVPLLVMSLRDLTRLDQQHQPQA